MALPLSRSKRIMWFCYYILFWDMFLGHQHIRNVHDVRTKVKQICWNILVFENERFSGLTSSTNAQTKTFCLCEESLFWINLNQERSNLNILKPELLWLCIPKLSNECVKGLLQWLTVLSCYSLSKSCIKVVPSYILYFCFFQLFKSWYSQHLF